MLPFHLSLFLKPSHWTSSIHVHTHEALPEYWSSAVTRHNPHSHTHNVTIHFSGAEYHLSLWKSDSPQDHFSELWKYCQGKFPVSRLWKTCWPCHGPQNSPWLGYWNHSCQPCCELLQISTITEANISLVMLWDVVASFPISTEYKVNFKWVGKQRATTWGLSRTCSSLSTYVCPLRCQQYFDLNYVLALEVYDPFLVTMLL